MKLRDRVAPSSLGRTPAIVGLAQGGDRGQGESRHCPPGRPSLRWGDGRRSAVGGRRCRMAAKRVPGACGPGLPGVVKALSLMVLYERGHACGSLLGECAALPLKPPATSLAVPKRTMQAGEVATIHVHARAAPALLCCWLASLALPLPSPCR